MHSLPGQILHEFSGNPNILSTSFWYPKVIGLYLHWELKESGECSELASSQTCKVCSAFVECQWLSESDQLGVRTK